MIRYVRTVPELRHGLAGDYWKLGSRVNRRIEELPDSDRDERLRKFVILREVDPSVFGLVAGTARRWPHSERHSTDPSTNPYQLVDERDWLSNRLLEQRVSPIRVCCPGFSTDCNGRDFTLI